MREFSEFWERGPDEREDVEFFLEREGCRVERRDLANGYFFPLDFAPFKATREGRLFLSFVYPLASRFHFGRLLFPYEGLANTLMLHRGERLSIALVYVYEPVERTETLSTGSHVEGAINDAEGKVLGRR